MRMTVALTDVEAKNVMVALLAFAKSPNVDGKGMKVLLALSEKFIKPEPEELKTDILTGKKEKK